jgi:AraC family transcriptional regulator
LFSLRFAFWRSRSEAQLRDNVQPSVAYREYHGWLEANVEQRPPAGDIVVFSNIERASAMSPARPGLCVRYVGRGRENYRIDERGVRVGEGENMIAAQASGAEIDVRPNELHGTLGLCVLISPEPDAEQLPWLFGPMIFNSACSPLGAIMSRQAKLFCDPTKHKREAAAQLSRDLRAALPAVSRTVVQQAAAMEAAKPATRYELVRRASLAQSYLHSIVDRPVSLDELAEAVGASEFQLLRAFQKCFGDTPAAYHRRLRLNRVVEEARLRDISLASASQMFGFADGSSFSHCYRRTFGRAPVWSKAD